MTSNQLVTEGYPAYSDSITYVVYASNNNGSVGHPYFNDFNILQLH